MDWSENQPGAAESFTPLWLKTKKISTCITSERTSVHNPENNEYVMDHYPSWAALSVRRLLKEGSCLPRNRALHPQICSLLLKMLAAKIVLPSLETSGAKKIFKLFFFHSFGPSGREMSHWGCGEGEAGTARAAPLC